MLNQLVLVGRLVGEPIKEDNKVKITIATPRNYKNEEGAYDTDFIDVVLWNGIADNVIEYCKKGDLLGVRGRIQITQLEDKKITEIIAEKITFLSTAKQKQEEE